MDRGKDEVSRRVPPVWPVALTAAGLGFVVLIANAFGSLASGCKTDTAKCALSGPHKKIQGRVFTPEGKPADHARVSLDFNSMHGQRVTAVTDDQGRFCLRWPPERRVTYAKLSDVRSNAPADFRLRARPPGAFANTPRSGPILVAPGESSLSVVDEPIRLSDALFNPQRDTASHCPESSVQPRWDRVDTLTSNWRYRLIEYLAFACIAWPVAVALTAPPHRRRVARLGQSAGLLGILLFVLVWLTHTI